MLFRSQFSQAVFKFLSVGGTTYQIAVDGYGGDQGDVTLNWSLPGSGGS